jgi:hypothetical protein
LQRAAPCCNASLPGAFEIKCGINGYLLRAKTAAERDEWLDALHRAHQLTWSAPHGVGGVGAAVAAGAWSEKSVSERFADVLRTGIHGAALEARIDIYNV